jgi:hypothetical protein
MSDAAGSVDIDTLLERSEEFEQAVQACFPESGLVLAIASQQHELVATACALSIEHAVVLRSAFAIAAPNSGAAVLRLQYEALLRAAWLLYAASPDQVAKLGTALDLEAEQAAKKLPGYLDMLNAVSRTAPVGLSAPLGEFNQYSRHALNSFVHSGIHPLHRARDGFPAPLGATLVRFSNGLMHFAYRLLASLSGSQRRMDRVTRLYREYKDCVPMATGRSEGTVSDYSLPED